MCRIKIYDVNDKILFNKNKLFCFVYKYEKDSEILYSFNVSDKPSKYHSIFEYIENKKEGYIRVSITTDYLEYETNLNDEQEKGRVPLKNKKRNWSKKTITLDDNKLEIENFDGNRSIVYKLKEEFFNKLINIKNGKQ